MVRRAIPGVVLALWGPLALAAPHRAPRPTPHRPHHGDTHRRDTARRHHHHTPRVTSAVAPRPPPVAAALPSSPRPALGTRSAGCSSPDASAPTGVGEASLTVGGRERRYLYSVPEHLDARGAPAPLVFAFHGLTGTPTSLRGYLRLEREAAGAAIFVYPAGQRVPRGRETVTRWDLRANGVDVAFFDAMLAELGRRYCVDLGRVFADGHSAGAVMTNEVACHRGNVLRAVAPIAGSGPWSRRCVDAPSVWLTHGRADAPVPFRFGEGSRDHWVAAARCDATPAPTGDGDCVRYEGCADGARVVFCPHGGDHGPPEFAPRSIWSFFTSR